MLHTDEILARVLFHDGLCLVIDKPAGWAVHAEGSGQRHLGRWLPSLRLGRGSNPEVAHRLDRDTTGCLVLGRHPKALRRLHELFSQQQVKKLYWAILEGHPPDSQGRIELALSEKERGVVRLDPDGKAAVTEYRVLQRTDNMTWVELSPLTGRTHQLRAHMAALGCPIQGDGRYGAKQGALLLHARRVELPLYPRKPALVVEAPLPESWLRDVFSFEQSFSSPTRID